MNYLSLNLFQPEFELVRCRVRIAWTRLVIRVVETCPVARAIGGDPPTAFGQEMPQAIGSGVPSRITNAFIRARGPKAAGEACAPSRPVSRFVQRW